ncbi:MAG: RsiV family protein [Bacteroidota bacterium]|nr:RsiV family protein [Bacteroidota bacterium]
MKTKFIFLVLSCLALESFTEMFPAHHAKWSLKGISSRKFAGSAIPYHYDSVRLSSPYQFDHPARASTQGYVVIKYPIFQNNDLNEIIKKAVLSPLKVNYQFKNAVAAEHPALSNLDAINNPAADYKALAGAFLKQFEAQAPQEDLQAYWYADIEVKAISDQTDYIALLCKKDYFTGGSHDLYDHIYLNYDVRNHRLVTLTSVLQPGKLNQLKVIAERIFRKNEGLTPTQELDGYFFQNGKFDLPDNFTITSKGLMFLYDYYELKPFAAGTTALIIPFADLKHLVLPNSIWARRIQ